MGSESEWQPDPSTPVYIVCAANRNELGEIIASARHCDKVMIGQKEHRYWNESREEQGFIDQFCRFWSRTEAWKIAVKAGQIRRRCGGDTADGGTLYSENLY